MTVCFVGKLMLCVRLLGIESSCIMVPISFHVLGSSDPAYMSAPFLLMRKSVQKYVPD